MPISKVMSSAATDFSKRVGRAILDNKPSGQKLSHGLRTVNNFIQGEGYNPGRGAYYTLISAFVIIPRLMQVREPDEFREVLTRDVTSVLAILFAMKGLKSGMCSKAQRDSGLVLVKDTVGKNAGKMKRLLGYLNPEGGISALGSDEILAKYSNIKNRDTLVNAMTSIADEGGDLGKVFSIENQKEGLFARAKRYITGKPKAETPLYNAAKKMFGEGFESKTNEELIQTVKDISTETPLKLEGLTEIVGENPLAPRAFDLIEGAQETTGGILNSDKNPLTYYARNVASNFETISLALTAGFLGFGLPKLNELMTKKKHLNKPGLNPNRASNPQVIGAQASGQIYTSIKKTSSASAFQNFMGK